jgi:hypothetical protein
VIVLQIIPDGELPSTITLGNGRPSLLTVCTLIVLTPFSWPYAPDTMLHIAVMARASLLQEASKRRTLQHFRTGVLGIKREALLL